MNFPSQKLFFFFIPVVVVLGAFTLIKNNLPQVTGEEIKGLEVVVDQKTNLDVLPEPDSDGDGLKDWEEVILGTDPQKSDSDGNGISDKIDNEDQKNEASPSPYASSGGKSLTQTAGRELLSQYFSLKQTDSLNATNIDLLADRIVAELKIDSDAKIYEPKDLEIVTSASDLVVKTYGNTLANIRNTYFEEYKENPIQSPSGFDLKNVQFVDGIKRVSDIYEKLSEDIMVLTVPYEIAGKHLELSNNYLESSVVLTAMVEIGDPLKSLSALSEYLSLQTVEAQILKSIAIYFDQSGIIFSEDEEGYFWVEKLTDSN